MTGSTYLSVGAFGGFSTFHNQVTSPFCSPLPQREERIKRKRKLFFLPGKLHVGYLAIVGQYTDLVWLFTDVPLVLNFILTLMITTLEELFSTRANEL